METTKTTGTSMKGKHFEKRVLNRLKSNFDDCIILNDVNIPGRRDKTAQIDFILLHETGLYIMEAKGYSGTVTGSVDDVWWEKTLTDEAGNVFKRMVMSPMKQNEGHIRHIRKIVGEDVPLVSVAILSEKCDFSSICMTGATTYVFHLKESMVRIREIMESSEEVIDSKNLEKFSKMLNP